MGAVGNGTSNSTVPSAADARPPIEDHDLQLNLTVWLLTTIATLFRALRVYAKVWRKRAL